MAIEPIGSMMSPVSYTHLAGAGVNRKTEKQKNTY